MQRKRVKRQPAARPNRPNRIKERSLIKPLSVLFLMIALCVGAYWNVNGGTVSEQIADTKFSSISDGKASGKDMDYTESASELQAAVDAWLKSQEADITSIESAKRTEDRRATGGKIYWTVNKVQVVPHHAFSRADLENELGKSNGKAILYNVEKTILDGTDVTEYDIALFDMLDKEQLSMVVEKLYVTTPDTSSSILTKVKAMITGAIKGTPKAKPAVGEKAKNGPVNKAETHPTNVKGKLAIVIDDFGYRSDVLSSFNNLPVPLTYAVIPNRPYTSECAESGYNAGRQIFAHIPMQPLNIESSEPVYVSPDMSAEKIKNTTTKLLNQIPHVIGANNHQGSYTTADTAAMKEFLGIIKSRNLVFLDSRTNSASVAAQTASSMGVTTGRNSLFIDNDDDVASIESRLRQAGQIALNNGSCIVIGHCRPNTAAAIKSMINELHNEGVDIVFASDLMQ